ncbi:MAG: hypothetical protein RL090_1656 [Bacteroidota bacterium]
MKKRIILAVFVLLISILAPALESTAQCSMCRAVASSGERSDSTRVAKGLNNGILYLLSMPYILGGVAYFIWRRNRRQAG